MPFELLVAPRHCKTGLICKAHHVARDAQFEEVFIMMLAKLVLLIHKLVNP